MAAKAFDVDVEELFKTVTEARIGKGLNERIISHSRSEAIFTRNKIMHCMYEGVFRMIFNQVNHAVSPLGKPLKKKLTLYRKRKRRGKVKKRYCGRIGTPYDDVLSFTPGTTGPDGKAESEVRSKHGSLAARNEAHKAKTRAMRSKAKRIAQVMAMMKKRMRLIFSSACWISWVRE